MHGPSTARHVARATRPHGLDGALEHAARESPPTRVHGRDHALGRNERDGRAVGGEDGERTAGSVGDRGVGPLPAAPPGSPTTTTRSPCTWRNQVHGQVDHRPPARLDVGSHGVDVLARVPQIAVAPGREDDVGVADRRPRSGRTPPPIGTIAFAPTTVRADRPAT